MCRTFLFPMFACLIFLTGCNAGPTASSIPLSRDLSDAGSGIHQIRGDLRAVRYSDRIELADRRFDNIVVDVKAVHKRTWTRRISGQTEAMAFSSGDVYSMMLMGRRPKLLARDPGLLAPPQPVASAAR